MDAKALAYKVGFLRKIAEAGLLPSEVMAFIKAAADKPPAEGKGKGEGGSGAMKKLLGVVGSLPSAMKTTVGAGMAIPAAVGAGAGALQSWMEAPVMDPDMLKKLETIRAYQEGTRKALERQRGGANVPVG